MYIQILIHVHFNYSPWQSESHTNASKPKSEQHQSDLVARKLGISAPLLSASINVVKSDQRRLGATWEGGKHQTRRYFTLYVPWYKHLDESTCKGAWWSWATQIPEKAPKHRPWSRAKPTSCYSKMMYLQQGLHPRRITSYCYLLGTMRAENHLTPYYHNSFHTSQPTERSVGMLKKKKTSTTSTKFR